MKTLVESLFDKDLTTKDLKIYMIELVDCVEYVSLGNRDIVNGLKAEKIDKDYKALPSKLTSIEIKNLNKFNGLEFRDPIKQRGCVLLKELLYILVCTIKVKDIYDMSNNRINWNKFRRWAEHILNKYIDGISLDMMLGYDDESRLCQFSFETIYNSMFFKIKFNHSIS